MASDYRTPALRRSQLTRLAAMVAVASWLLASCSGGSDAVEINPAPAATNVDIETLEVMVHVMDPSARLFWKGWGEVYTKEGWTDVSPRNEAEWKKVEDGAATVLVAADLLQQPAYVRAPNDDWTRFARDVAKIALEGKLGAERQDKQAMYELGATLDEACDACHAVFAPGAS